MKIVLRLGAVAVLLATLGAAAWLLRPAATAFHATSAEAALSALVLLAAAISAALLLRPAVGVRLAIVVVLFAAADALLIARALDRWPLPCDVFRSPRYVLFLSSVLTATAYGLVRRRLWARWLGLAFGSYGMVSAGINAVNFLGVADHWTWTFVAFALGSALVGLHLADPDVGEAFLARSTQASLWGSTDPLVRLSRAAIIATFAAVSMLLVYAWMQPFVPSTARSAEWLAALLGVGAVLTARRKVLGGLVLGLGGAGLAAQCLVTASRGASEPELVAYYLVFWVPAALLGMCCGALMLRRALRLR
jgi:hypothetical protein